MPVYLTKSMFERNMNTKFRLTAPGLEQYPLDLVRLDDGFSNPRQEQFSVTFRGSGQWILPQQIYSMEHDDIGELDLFLVPIGRDESGVYYEAVFNRLLKAS